MFEESHLTYYHTEVAQTQLVQFSLESAICFRVVERYSLCLCPYQVYGVDECPLYQQREHRIQECVLKVGVICKGCVEFSAMIYSSTVGSVLYI
jgi:hypothetical protein